MGARDRDAIFFFFSLSLVPFRVSPALSLGPRCVVFRSFID